MRIVILADQFAPGLGGAIGVCYQHATSLAARGHQVTVIAAGGEAPAGSGVALRCVAAPFHPRWGAYLGLYHPAAVRQVADLLAEVKPEIVHAHNIYQALSYQCLSEAQQVCPKVFLTAHDVMSFAYAKLTHFIDPRRTDCPQRPNYHTPWLVNLRTAQKRFNPLRNAAIRRRLNGITKVLAVSQALADALSDNGITNVAVVRNGIDLAPWTPPAPAVLKEFLHRHEVAHRRVMLFSGRISGAKGINQILAAISRIKTAVPDVVLLVAGSAEGGLQAYQQLPGRYGVAEHVRFVGQLAPAEMIAAYHACDIVVVPSVCFDSFPSVNLEAMAAGKPVVATCFGGSREAVVDGRTGYVVNPYDTQTLVDRMLHLLTNPTLAAQLGQAGRRRIEQEFSLDRWLGELLAWYGQR